VPLRAIATFPEAGGLGEQQNRDGDGGHEAVGEGFGAVVGEGEFVQGVAVFELADVAGGPSAFGAGFPAVRFDVASTVRAPEVATV
jgi:hypothetical protein